MSLRQLLTSWTRRNSSSRNAHRERRRALAVRRRRQSRGDRQRWSGQLEMLEGRTLMAADIIVSPDGHDLAGLGTVDAPFATIRRALDAAQPGDTISLRNGVYEGGLNIDIDNLTLRSYPGEWGVIQLPTDDPQQGTVVRYLSDVQGGRLENVEIVGGYWYGVKLDDWWDNPGPDAVRRGASHITISGCKIHDTGWDAVKIVPGADDITIVNNEIYRSGRRWTVSADGIDNNNGDRMIARSNYLHDIPGIGILTTGGTHDSLIEQNLIVDTQGAGITVGFYSELEWMDQDSNPELFTSFHTVARNNVIVDAGQAGIGIYSSYQPVVVHNTIVSAASEAQAPIQLGGVDIWVSDELPLQHVVSIDPVIANNLITLDPDDLTRLLDIRYQSYAGLLTIDGNLYHAPTLMGARFIDRNVTGEGTPEQSWSQWQAAGHDSASLLQDPLLDAQFHLAAASPARDAGLAAWLPAGDFDGHARSDGMPDIGADEFSLLLARPVPPPAFGAPALEFTARAFHALEGELLEVVVERSGSVDDQVTVEYRTIAGSAQAGTDFTPVAGTLVFAPGQVSQTIQLPFLADGVVEGNEHLLLELHDPTTTGALPVRLGWQSVASLTIDDGESEQPVHYRTLWVSNAGSDVAGDGSQAHPWKSLAYAASQVGPGDYVNVEAGNYQGFQITTDGRPDAPITFHAEPGVVIDEPNPENLLDGINLEGADHVVIEGFQVHDMPRTGIRSVLNTGAVIRGNQVDHNGYWGILTGWSENLLVENNVASRSIAEHGIYISNSSDDAIIRHNIVWGNHDSGIQFNADGGLEGDGVHSRNLIEGNVIFANGTGGGAAINLDGFQDGIVRNNLLYDNHSTGIVLYVAFGAEGSRDNLVVNNTVVQAADARWAVLIENESTGNTLRNNIFYHPNSDRGSIRIDASSLPGLDSDYNALVDRFTAGGWQTIDFTSWQASTGQDTHSFLADPGQLFVDAAQANFQLAAASPALDVGDAAVAPAHDLYQHVRPMGAGVDLGALEAGPVIPLVQFSAADFVTYEGSGMALLTVTRSGDTSQPLTVSFSTSDGTAIAGSDYDATTGIVQFQPGEVSRTVQILTRDDAEIEPLETFVVTLASPSGGTQLGPLVTTTVHIASDDAWRPGQFQFTSRFVSVNEAAGEALLTVERVGGANGPASVHYATSLFIPPAPVNYIRRHTWNPQPTDDDDPATPGQDVEWVAGVLAFADGETTKTISIPLLDDAWFERDEALRVTLSDPTDGATLGKIAESFVEIINDDVKQPGTFRFLEPEITVIEGQPFASLVVERTGGHNVAASVRLFVSGGDGTATHPAAWQPSDFGSLPDELVFAAGESSRTILVPLVEDSQVEEDEFFQVSLYGATNDAAIGDPSRVTVRIRDNDSSLGWSQGGAFAAAENAGTVPITVRRQGSTAGAVSVSFRTYDLSATAPSDYASTQGVIELADGESSKTVLVPLVNDTLTEPNERFGIELVAAQGTQLGDSRWGTVTILNDDVALQPGTLELSAATYSVVENAGTASITVVRTGGSDGTVSVQYSTSDGAAGASWSKTAWAGGDYSSANGLLVFAPGETVKTFSVPIKNDSSVEQDEVFTVKLSNVAGGASLGATTKAVVTILEDDSSFAFRAANGASNFSVQENAGAAEITIVRQGGLATPASVTVKTSDWGSAQAGTDFVPVNTTVQFAPGESSKIVLVPIINDSLLESSESVGVALSNPVGASQSSWTWSLQIQDDDNLPQPGQFQFQYATFSTQENWGYAVIYVTRTGGSSGAVSVNYSVQGATAQAGVDFQAVAGTLSFADGEITKTFQVPLLDDALAEMDEELLLLLSQPQGGASLGAIDQAVLKIVSNE
ncbi:MAG: Calx-beta domain-containing protein [Pirellulales bacterium]